MRVAARLWMNQAVDEGVVVGLGVWCKGEPSQHSHDHVTSAELTVYLLH